MYKIAAARQHFAAIVKQAEGGEEIILTRHGKPVVAIRPVKGEILEPGFMLAEGWSVKMAEDFDAMPPGFEPYT